MLFRLGIALIGGILMGLTTAPVRAWPLAWVALVPLWIFLVRDRRVEKNNTPIPLLGLAWGIGYHGIALSWIIGLHPLTWLGFPWLGSIAIALSCWVFITLWGAALVVAWAISSATIFQLIQNSTPKPSQGTNKLFPPSLLGKLVPPSLVGKGVRGLGLPYPKTINTSVLTRVLIGTALWCILETLWSAGPLWWTALSFTQSPYNLPILHLGQLSGPNTITAVIVAVNGLLAEAWLNHKTQQQPTNSPSLSFALFASLRFVFHKGYLATAAALLISSHLIGFGLYNQPLNDLPNTALKVGIIQGNIPNRIKFDSDGLHRALVGYINGYRTLAQQGVDAVLTPEGALSFLWTEPLQPSNALYQTILDEGVVTWIGAHHKQGRNFTNSLFTVSKTGEILSRYDKVHLVALGEYIPFEKFLGRIVNLSAIGASQVPGSPNQVFDTPFGRVIVGICYDSAFSRHFQRQAAAGGQFILTASNNDPYSAAMQFQHHAQDVMRAIETDRWAVRATNTGYSGIVDPHGRTLWRSGHNTYEVHAATIYRRQTQTLYVRWGNWLTPVLLILGFGSLIYKRVNER